VHPERSGRQSDERGGRASRRSRPRCIGGSPDPRGELEPLAFRSALLLLGAGGQRALRPFWERCALSPCYELP
jgi:hypothetical protein